MYDLKNYEVDCVVRILRDLDECHSTTVKGKNALRKASLLYKRILKRHDKAKRCRS